MRRVGRKWKDADLRLRTLDDRGGAILRQQDASAGGSRFHAQGGFPGAAVSGIGSEEFQLSPLTAWCIAIPLLPVEPRRHQHVGERITRDLRVCKRLWTKLLRAVIVGKVVRRSVRQ